MQVEVQPLVSPEYLHRATGVKFDARFHCDPEYRAGQAARLAEASAALIPEDFRAALPADYWSAGTLDIGVGQTFLLVAALFGSQFEYADNYFPNATNRPLEGWPAARIAHLTPPDVENCWPLNAYLAQYDRLVARYGAERVSLPGFALWQRIFHGGEYFAGTFHSPVTQAYRLRGPQLFYDMVDHPGVARHLLQVVVETGRRCIDAMAARAGARVELIYQLCCIASLLSPGIFEAWELPAMLDLFGTYGVRNRVHSCGPSTHLLAGLAKIPNLVELELGEGTDMAAARRLWPQASLVYCIDSPRLPARSVPQIKTRIREVIGAAGSGPLTIQLVYEEGLRLEQFHAVYDVVREHNTRARP